MDEDGLGEYIEIKSCSKTEFDAFCNFVYGSEQNRIKWVDKREYVFVYWGGRYAGIGDCESKEYYVRVGMEKHGIE